MAKLKSLVVRRRQHVELSDRTVLLLGGSLVDLRPRTPNALKTLLFEMSRKPARLHDPKSYDRLPTRKGYLELLPDKQGRFQGLSYSTLISILRTLPEGATIPRSVELHASKRACGCKTPGHVHESNKSALRADVLEFAVPEWLRKLRVFRVAAWFQDIIVESGGLLTINSPTIVARNFILHTGGQVKQRVPVVMDLSGSFRAGAAADAAAD